MERFSEYDPFARAYNRHWGNVFTSLVFPVLEKHLFNELPPDALILDLCCGTGNLARMLIDNGYRVTGIDGSAEMLGYAGENAPSAEFILADARSFELPEIYDAAVSVFDSLNHIMSLRELVNVFQNVYNALREGGLFLFDLNMAAGFETKWRNESSVVEEDQVCLLRSSYNPESRIAVFEATIFDKDDGWRRTDITLHQKCYSEREVLAALGEAGFEEVHSYSCDVSCRLGELQEDAERAFFIARKPGTKGQAGKKQ